MKEEASESIEVPLTKRQSLIILALYACGWILDWGYLIALAKETDGVFNLITAVGAGWLLALLWPLHASVELWIWLLGGN